MATATIKIGEKRNGYTVVDYRHITFKDPRLKYRICLCDECGAVKWIQSLGEAPKKCECSPRVGSRIYIPGKEYGSYTLIKRNGKNSYRVKCECGIAKNTNQLYNPPLKCNCRKYKKRSLEDARDAFGEEWQAWLKKDWGKTSRQHLNWVKPLNAISARSLGLLRDLNWRNQAEEKEILSQVRNSLPQITVFRNISICPIK